MLFVVFLITTPFIVGDVKWIYAIPLNPTYLSNSTTVSSRCPFFQAVPNAFIELKPDSGTLSARIICNENYSLLGRAEFYCNGLEWDFEPEERFPKCVKRCPPPPFLEHGKLELDKLTEDIYSPNANYLSGTVVKYTCLEGYTLEPSISFIRLCENGHWIGKDAFCKPNIDATCVSPPQIEHGFVQPNFPVGYSLISIGEEVRYHCDHGFKLVGSEKVKCTERGIWEPSIPRCEKDTETFANLACASVPLLDPKLHPHIRLISISATTVEIGCDRNYQNALAPCQTSKFFCKNEKWTGIYPECVEVHMCSPPPAIQYAEIIDRDYDKSYETNGLSYFSISAQVTYECLKGYVMDGSRTITCQDNGCWEPMDMWPTCIRTKENYFVELDDLNAILISSATGAGVLGILLLACLVVACKKRKALARTVSLPTPTVPPNAHHPPEVINDHAVLLQHPDRLALIAFADGVQNNQNTLPSYDEATRDRSTLIQVSRLQLHRPHWPSLAICRGSNRSRNSSNTESGHHVVRHGSFVSHTPSMRSGGESMGSTDTVTISEGSTNITLDTASSHSAISQNPSCRGHCGSLASFDGCSIVNTEGVPLLEESELEEIQGGTNEVENPVVSDNTSSKISTHSAPVMTN